MAVTPRTFLRNHSLLVLLAATAVTFAAFFDCPTRDACPSSNEVTDQAAVAKAHVRASEKVARMQAAQATASPADSRGWLGVGIATLDAKRAKCAGLEATRGVLITEVQPGMPAETSGFRTHDVVTHVNDRRITKAWQLKKRIGQTAPDTRLAVRILRDGVPVTLYPTLTRASEAPETGGCTRGKARNR